jgi:glyoxylase-like metal-dependent hydrolase (beta-lactamase superfamily II)
VKIGEIDVVPVVDGYGATMPTRFFRTTEEDWQDHQQYLRPDGSWEFPVGAFIVRTGGRVVLVDAGLGPRKFAYMVGGQLLENLSASGVEVEDVTDVVITHPHWDHIGWVSHHGSFSFPNATYHCHVDDWQHFTQGPGAARLAEGSIIPADGFAREDGTWLDVLLAIGPRLETWDTDRALFPGVNLVVAPGHTPGSSMVIVSSGIERAFIVGDVMHCPAQLTEPEWGAYGDFDPAAAARTRTQLAVELESGDSHIAAPHFPGMQFGRVLMSEGRRQWLVS